MWRSVRRRQKSRDRGAGERTILGDFGKPDTANFLKFHNKKNSIFINILQPTTARARFLIGRGTPHVSQGAGPPQETGPSRRHPGFRGHEIMRVTHGWRYECTTRARIRLETIARLEYEVN
jgi:hypothetical protein